MMQVVRNTLAREATLAKMWLEDMQHGLEMEATLRVAGHYPIGGDDEDVETWEYDMNHVNKAAYLLAWLVELVITAWMLLVVNIGKLKCRLHGGHAWELSFDGWDTGEWGGGRRLTDSYCTRCGIDNPRW